MDWKRYAFLLGVTVGVLHATPQLRLGMTVLGPINVAQNASGPTQTVVATNIGDGTLNLSLSASASWLVPTVVNGLTVQIALNTATLAPGTYSEFVTVAAPGALDAPQYISVSVVVSGLPQQIQLYTAPGGTPAKQEIDVGNFGQVQVTTSTGGAWLSAPSNKGFLSYYPYLVTVNPSPSVNQVPTPLPQGDYNGSVTLSGSPVATENGTIPVIMHITTNPILQFSTNTLEIFAGAGGPAVVSSAAVSNIGQGTLSISGATSSAPWLTAAVTNNNAVAVTANPAGLTAGTYHGTITLASNAANTSSATLQVELIVQPSAAPIISFGGVVDNASGQTTLAPGMIASIYGVELASGATPVSAASLPLTNSLGGVQVLVNGALAPVYYVSANQINFVVPWAAQQGQATITTTFGGLTSNPVSAPIVTRAPRIPFLPLGSHSLEYGIIVNTDYTLAVPPAIGAIFGASTHAAKIGDTVTIYALGFGLTDQTIADGAASPTSPLANAPSTTAIFGGVFNNSVMASGTVLFSGLTPGFVGLYQVNVTIPPNSPTGDTVALQLQAGGATSNLVYVAISN